MFRPLLFVTLLALMGGILPHAAYAQLFPRRPSNSTPVGSVETHIVESAAQVLDEIMVDPGKAIPKSMLQDAQGIAIVPSLLKGGFVVGVKHGRGVVVVRNAQNGWQPPQFVTISGGSLGWQAGIQQSDLVLVFKTARSVESLMSGKLTIGADAAAAAGPVGRQAAAATDVGLKAEIYSYSRSRGLFAGVALDGSVMQIDSNAGAVFYASVAAAPPGAGSVAVGALPPAADRLMRQIDLYTQRGAAGGTVPAPDYVNPVPANVPGATPLSPQDALAAARRDAANSQARLMALLDDTWRQYLGIPPQLLEATPANATQTLAPLLDRYERVSTDPSFGALAGRAEFTGALQALRKYTELAGSQSGAAISLPPPPAPR